MTTPAISETTILSTQNLVLQDAWHSVQAILADFATNPNFETILEQAFGNAHNPTVSLSLQAAWQSGIFDNLPTVEIRSREDLREARGVYVAQTNTIYLADSFLANATSGQIMSVLL